MNYKALFDTHHIQGRVSDVPLKAEWAINPEKSNAAFAAKQAHCESVGSSDQFDHLSSLASSEDTSSRLRCGWVYNNGNPDNGRGAYGLSEGPLKTNTPGQWMWNLNKAKEKYHTAICQRVQSCSDIDSDIYKKRCGWCTRSGKAVPVSGGQLAYPAGTNTTCPTNNIVYSSAQCPRPPSINDPNYVRTPAEACIPYPNGSLGRDCLLQKVTAAGCSDRGTLAQALRAGSNNNYTSALSQEKAFKIYQERSAMPMDSTALRTGKITVTDALNTFSKVQDMAASDANGGLQYAARDLCLNKGAIDEYDFCAELLDTTAAPFELDCLQKIFMRMGGQKAGKSFPTTANIKFYNNLGNWLSVKKYIQGIFDKTKSQDRKTQEWAMNEFYGIRMQNKKHPLPYGPEIAWKDKSVVVSCQRPLGFPDGYTTAGCIDDEKDETFDKWMKDWGTPNGWQMGTPPEPPYALSYPNPGNVALYVPSNPYAIAGKFMSVLKHNGNSEQACRDSCDTDQECKTYFNIGDLDGTQSICVKSDSIDAHARRPFPTGGSHTSYIKTSTQCSGPYGNPPENVSGWNYKGCYVDSGDRTLTTRLPNTASTEECIANAKARGFNTIGRQYFGECWAGNNTDWNRLGRIGCCEPMGGPWNNQVYSSQ